MENKNTCMICFSDLQDGITLSDIFKKQDLICGNCRRKFVRSDKELIIDGLHIEALYVYDDFLENLLFQFKEGRDVALKEIFLFKHLKRINWKYRNYVGVYIPSSSVKNKERGFIALELLYENLKIEKRYLLRKNSDYKQSIQTFPKRKMIEDVLEIVDGFDVEGKRVLLLDDMCTSGSSLLAARKLLENANEVKALVIGVNRKLYKKS